MIIEFEFIIEWEFIKLLLEWIEIIIKIIMIHILVVDISYSNSYSICESFYKEDSSRNHYMNNQIIE